MEPDDFIADGQPDPAAPGLRGPLIKLLLNEGQFRFRDSGPMVPDGDDDLPVLVRHGGVDALPRAAVLGGVVQHVAENLFEPFRVPRNSMWSCLNSSI